jgi:hypothetical protein
MITYHSLRTERVSRVHPPARFRLLLLSSSVALVSLRAKLASCANWSLASATLVEADVGSVVVEASSCGVGKAHVSVPAKMPNAIKGELRRILNRTKPSSRMTEDFGRYQ